MARDGSDATVYPPRRNRPVRQGSRRPPQRAKGTPPAIEANRVGDGLQNRAWLGSTPAIASHRIRVSGTDTCRRPCRASPSVEVRLTGEPAELRA